MILCDSVRGYGRGDHSHGILKRKFQIIITASGVFFFKRKANTKMGVPA